MYSCKLNAWVTIAAVVCSMGLWSCQGGVHPYPQGQDLYTIHCANCHMEKGQGLGQLIPPLANSDWLKANRAAAACIIRNGLADTIIVNGKSYTEQMPKNLALSETEITNILNYIATAMNDSLPVWSIPEVVNNLKNCPPQSGMK